MPTYTVAVTDYTFDSLDVERGILGPLGCEVVTEKTGKDPARLAALVADADAVITQFAPVDAAVIAAMTRCRVIVRYGIGVDNVDLRAAADRGIPVCNVPDYCIDEVADHALAMILGLTRRITPNAAKVRGGGWGLAVPLQAMATLRDMTVGVVAFGRIGREVADRLRAFKSRVLVYDPHVAPADITAAGCTPASLDELLAASDLVTLHCPSTDATRGMIDAATIARMKPGVLLVNTSRGNLVKTDDLVEALRSGRVSGAALDVTDPEPPPAGSAIVGLDNVVITSHIASASTQAVGRLRRQAADTAALALQGKPLPNVVNGVRA